MTVLPPWIVHDERFRAEIGAHVFPMEKYDLVRRSLREEHGIPESEFAPPGPLPEEALLRVHTADYLADFRSGHHTTRTIPSELPLTPQIRDAFLLAAAGTLTAARIATERGVGFCIGGGFHHAYPDRAEGFCYLNDVAIAIRQLQADGVIRRATVVDADLHQGNGTAAIFREDDSVFTFSIHQEDNYPGIKERSDLDLGLPDGIGDAGYLAELERGLEASVDRFAPDLVAYVAGADPYEEDQLATWHGMKEGLGLSMEGLARRDRTVLDRCRAKGIPIFVTLAGGYAKRVEDTVRIHVATCLAFRGHNT